MIILLPVNCALKVSFHTWVDDGFVPAHDRWKQSQEAASAVTEHLVRNADVHF